MIAPAVRLVVYPLVVVGLLLLATMGKRQPSSPIHIACRANLGRTASGAAPANP